MLLINYKKILYISILAIFLFGGCARSKDIISGKQVHNYYKIEDEITFGNAFMQYQLELLAKSDMPVDSPMDNKDLDRLKQIANKIFAISHYPNFPYEIHLVHDDSVVNATSLPGGKVIIYTGLWNGKNAFVDKKNDHQLAAVVAHEVAHSNARHHTEHFSKILTTNIWFSAMTGVFAGTKYEPINAIFNVTESLMIPKFSRDDEYEADKIGLLYMARAGYDPHQAIELWKSASEKYNKEVKTDAFASHPPEWRRAEMLETYLPMALKYYEESKHGITQSTYLMHANLQLGSYIVQNNTCDIKLDNLQIIDAETYNKEMIRSIKEQIKYEKNYVERKILQVRHSKMKATQYGKNEFYIINEKQFNFYLFFSVVPDGSVVATDNRDSPTLICAGRFKDNSAKLKCELEEDSKTRTKNWCKIHLKKLGVEKEITYR
ncbi:MAG: M48 family metallopeptidase [Pseudomonadota bacterium]